MSAVPRWKLTYFNSRGRAETIRLLFAQADVPYEDIRIDRTQWSALKEKTPFGQLPILEVDGKVLAQSRAIEKYLAKTFGLNGKTDWESAKIDELIQSMEDLHNKLSPWFTEQDGVKKVEIFTRLFEEEITPFLKRCEQFLIKNGTGYFVGDQLTLADLALYDILSYFDEKLMPGHLHKYPKLAEFIEQVGNLPNIKAWVQMRPKTGH
uniref:Glutathione S-transferase 1 n=1 Tax=Syphacia muris TaxID=451379 RepID=A0A158R4S3_9BILA